MTISDVVEFLDDLFNSSRYGEDQNGVYLPSTRTVRRLGLALEPWSQIAEWTRVERLDALFLHRPWRLAPEQLADGVGVAAYHLAFDECLTLGFNPRLAEALSMSAVAAFGDREGRPIGMVGTIRQQGFAQLRRCVDEVFGGLEMAHAGVGVKATRIAVVGAITDALVREAAALQQAAHVYITGQWRQPAQAAVGETGLSVIAVGHRRTEEWGLRALAGILRERWSDIEVILPSSSESQPSIK